MTQPAFTCRRVQEVIVLAAIRQKSAKGALFQLIYNALSQPQRHQRAAIVNLCKQQGYTADRTTTALKVLEMAGWVHTTVDGLEVLVYLTEYAKLTGGAEL
jgi:hypothetical protein